VSGTIDAMAPPSGLTTAELVGIAQQLPDVLVKDGDTWSSLATHGSGFAWINHEEQRAMIKSSHAERAALVGSEPAVYSEGWATGSTAWVRIQLSAADPVEVRELLIEAWVMTAPKRAGQAFLATLQSD
jgi:hypothetical protein